MKTELILAPGTSPNMKKMAESIPPGALLQAYREARETFRTSDIVLVVNKENTEGFLASPRAAYIEKAFVRWNDVQRAAHPLAREAAQKKLQMPLDALAFWLVVEMPEQGAVACCAISVYLHHEDPAELS